MPNATHFPSGIGALADFIHSHGLKIGLYADAGAMTCSGLPGSLGYEEIDAQTFAEWGLDYLKYDNCYAPHPDKMEPQVRFTRMRDALKKTGRDILFAMSDWGLSSPWEYGQEVRPAALPAFFVMLDCLYGSSH